MHRLEIALDQAHGNPGFLSWHRAYLLDLERELQKIDPSVTLPYWRFDQPAPNAFTADFMGLPGPGDTVVFSETNLLRQWQTDGTPGVTREPGFNVQTARANVISQARTLSLGDDRPNAIFDRGSNQPGFDTVEFNPHGERAYQLFNPCWSKLVDDAVDLSLVAADDLGDLGGAYPRRRRQEDLGALPAGNVGSGASDAFELGAFSGPEFSD
jgi:Common central domain of tyrosinase